MKYLLAILALAALLPGALPAEVVAPHGHNQVKAAKRKPHHGKHVKAHHHHTH